MLTRRHLQIGLGVLWLLDAALQFQPYMFSTAFARDAIAGTADGQPGAIAAGVHWAAHLMTAAPVATNAIFATVRWTAIGLWALVWCGSALLQMLPAQRDSRHFPVAPGGILLLVGVLPILGRRAALTGAAAGAALGLTFWIFGQSFGQFWTGQATDPNSGPVLVLLSVALIVRTATAPVFRVAPPYEESPERPRMGRPIGLRAVPAGRMRRTKVA